MGYELRRQLADWLPTGLAGISSGERLVALEIADQANDRTRRAYGHDVMDIVVRRTGIANAKQVGKILGKLAANGLELRVPVTSKDGTIVRNRQGQVVYACNGHMLEFLVPQFGNREALKVPPAGDQEEEPAEAPGGLPEDSRKAPEDFRRAEAPPVGAEGPPLGTEAPPVGAGSSPCGDTHPLISPQVSSDISSSCAPVVQFTSLADVFEFGQARSPTTMIEVEEEVKSAPRRGTCSVPTHVGVELDKNGLCPNCAADAKARLNEALDQRPPRRRPVAPPLPEVTPEQIAEKRAQRIAERQRLDAEAAAWRVASAPAIASLIAEGVAVPLRPQVEARMAELAAQSELRSA